MPMIDFQIAVTGGSVYYVAVCVVRCSMITGKITASLPHLHSESDLPPEPIVGFLVRTGTRDVAVTFPDVRVSAIDGYWWRTITGVFSVVGLGSIDRCMQGLGVYSVVDSSCKLSPHGYWTRD